MKIVVVVTRGEFVGIAADGAAVAVAVAVVLDVVEVVGLAASVEVVVVVVVLQDCMIGGWLEHIVGKAVVVVGGLEVIEESVLEDVIVKAPASDEKRG